MSVHRIRRSNIPAAPISGSGGVRDNRGTPVDSRTRLRLSLGPALEFKTSNLRLVVLGLVVPRPGRRDARWLAGVGRIGSKSWSRVAPGVRPSWPRGPVPPWSAKVRSVALSARMPRVAPMNG